MSAINLRNLALLAAAGSAALLLGALAFQYIGGLPPCKMCIWQRWPHLVAVLIGAVFLVATYRILALAGAAAAITTGGIGVFHAGVEQGWWDGPDTCTSGSIEGLSASQLLDQIMAAPVVRCDDIAWQMLGVSMAGWNAIISFGLAGVWVLAWSAVRVR